MRTKPINESTDSVEERFDREDKSGILLVARAPKNAAAIDRHIIGNRLVVGRPVKDIQNDVNFQILDSALSKRHFEISFEEGQYWLSDLESRNGVFLNGLIVEEKIPLETQDVIRAGNCLFVFHKECEHLFNPPANRMGIIGSFHTERLINNLRSAASSSHSILLVGPSGSGKTLAARVLSGIMNLKLYTYNAATLPGNDVSIVDLFGVSSGVFSGISARPGLIENADGGVLFVDEVHNLPPERQRSLLLIIEENRHSRIGEPQVHHNVNVQFIFASNEPGPTYGLIHDFLNRQRIVKIPPLRDIRADIPAIFDYWLKEYLGKQNLDIERVFPELTTIYYEILCTDGLERDNVRGLKDLADRIATACVLGMDIDRAIREIFYDRFTNNIVANRLYSGFKKSEIAPTRSTEAIDESHIGWSSYYEQNRVTIEKVYLESGGSISKTQSVLESDHKLRTTRNTLEKYIHHVWKLPYKNEIK